ncbi:hypothetical protein A9K72_22725 [Mesorhizobium loti]|nr:hypothetical protein A9K72_22725 [Mesorhizobium loti]
MNLTTLANNVLQIDVDATACGQAGIEDGSRFAASLSNLVGFKRAFDHVGYRAVLATSKPMSQVTCFRAADRELWFGHLRLPLEKGI